MAMVMSNEHWLFDNSLDRSDTTPFRVLPQQQTSNAVLQKAVLDLAAQVSALVTIITKHQGTHAWW